jgi:hypothetical protein
MGIGFNADIYENKKGIDIGKWCVIYRPNYVFMGKIANINEEEMILNPHRSSDYINNKHKILLISKELKVPLSNREGLEEVSKEWIDRKIKSDNKDLEEKKLKEPI